jgi:acetyl esterase/lipase
LGCFVNVKSLALGLSWLLAAPMLRAEEPLVVPLWTNGAPGFEKLRDEPEVVTNGRVRHVNNPSLTIFLPPKDKANGAGVLICPGGGFSELSYTSEGLEPARYFTNLGVAAFILKYRLPRETNSPYSLQVQPRQDGQRAVRLIRSRAEEWNLDTNRIGMIGFSAGGEVESCVVYYPPGGEASAPDPIDRLEAVVNFQMVLYPGPFGIPSGAVPTNVPPAFFVIANDDTSHMGAVLAEVNKYHQAGGSIEVHIYAHGGHGFGLATHSKFASVKDWPRRMTDWLEENHFLRPAPPPATR